MNFPNTTLNKMQILIGILARKSVEDMLPRFTQPLEDKVAIITASTDEIGFSAARQLLSDGATVMISGREQNNVDQAVEELQQVYGTEKVRGFVCDLLQTRDRANLIKETVRVFGGIDILVTNTAANPTSREENDLDLIFGSNFKIGFIFADEVVPFMVSRGGGAIVYIARVTGVSPVPMLGAYSTSKAALQILTNRISNNLALKNIRVNSVAPGIIQTDFALALTEKEPLREYLLQMIPVGRSGRPDEIGNVVSFLCSSRLTFVTGEVIVASGGTASRM